MAVQLSPFERFVKDAVESAINKRLRNKDLVSWSLGRQADYVKNPPAEGEHFIEVKIEGQPVFVNYTVKKKDKPVLCETCGQSVLRHKPTCPRG